mmetsp:Transcript_14576/g.16834  ORF Transcript_14576/g.16834 Transcript_14576/m.16834 type:complete len:89 (+) Transcript_14576:229-495(+)
MTTECVASTAGNKRKVKHRKTLRSGEGGKEEIKGLTLALPNQNIPQRFSIMNNRDRSESESCADQDADITANHNAIPDFRCHASDILK